MWVCRRVLSGGTESIRNLGICLLRPDQWRKPGPQFGGEGRKKNLPSPQIQTARNSLFLGTKQLNIE